MDKEEKKRLAKEKDKERQKRAEELGEKVKKSGSAMVGCGCLLTLFVTIPILLFFFL